MISMFKFATQVARKFTLVDWSIAKIDLIIVGLLLAKLFPVLTSLHRGWYVVLIVLAEIYFIRRIKQMKIGGMDK